MKGKKRRKRGGLSGVRKSENQNLESFKTIVIYSTLGLAVTGGAVVLARKLWNKSKKRAVDNRSLEEGDPATFARQLKMAFENDMAFGMGTDEELIFNVFHRIPSKDFFKKVQSAYQIETNGRNLNSDLSDELSSSEYSEVIRILSSKRQR